MTREQSCPMTSEDFEFVRIDVEVAEIAVTPRFLLGDLRLHVGAVVAMEGVALDELGRDVLAPENHLEDALDRRRPRAGGTGD